MKKNMMQTMARADRIRYLANLLTIWQWRRANA